jgi:opacity protein-like surface antigen
MQGADAAFRAVETATHWLGMGVTVATLGRSVLISGTRANVVGRFKIHNRGGLTLGAGVQIASTHYHQYKDGLILTARVPF